VHPSIAVRRVESGLVVPDTSTVVEVAAADEAVPSGWDGLGVTVIAHVTRAMLDQMSNTKPLVNPGRNSVQLDAVIGAQQNAYLCSGQNLLGILWRSFRGSECVG
jgi:hypothetical protein